MESLGAREKRSPLSDLIQALGLIPLTPKRAHNWRLSIALRLNIALRHNLALQLNLALRLNRTSRSIGFAAQ